MLRPSSRYTCSLKAANRKQIVVEANHLNMNAIGITVEARPT
jgi:hypothetical protein